MKSLKGVFIFLVVLISIALACDSSDKTVARSTVVSKTTAPKDQSPTATDLPTNPPTAADDTPPINTIVPNDTSEPEPKSTPLTLVRVVPTSINVRNGPSTNYDVITLLNSGDVVPLVGQTDDGSWYQIQLDDGALGWVGSSVTELDLSNDSDLTELSEESGQPTVVETSTSEPPPAVTPSPVPSLYVEVFNVSDYKDRDGDLWLYGEVLNLGSKIAKHIDLTATLYDASDVVTAVDSSYADMPLDFSLWYTGVLFPGERAPFSIWIEDPGSWESWRLTATYEEARPSDYDEHYTDLRILNHQGRSIDGFFDNYKVAGEIENTGNYETGQVRITTTLYNADGRVVGSDELGMSELDPLLPGQITPFSVELYAREPVHSYALFIRSVRHD